MIKLQGPIINYESVETRMDAREFVGSFDPQCVIQCGILQRRQNNHFQKNSDGSLVRIQLFYLKNSKQLSVLSLSSVVQLS